MASIKCYHCKKTHTNVATVRACSQGMAQPDANQTVESWAANIPAGTPLSERVNKPSPVDRIRTAAACLPNTKKCRYALHRDGIWKFYVVSKPQSGRWAGYTFVSRLASDTEYRVSSVNAQADILEAIAFNVEQAASDYGHQVGRCGICNRTLTDQESINLGIGPICAGKVGW